MIAWAKFRLRFEISAESGEDALYSAGETRDGAFEGRRLHMLFSREPATGPPEDRAMLTMDFLNLTAGEPDSTWTGADFDAIEARLATWWTAIKDNFRATTIADQIRWYRFGPQVATPQPVLRVVEWHAPGTGTGRALPPQVAMTITERTAVRKRWGRIYLPAPHDTSVSDDGRIQPTVCADLVTATAAFYAGCFADDLIPVVYSPTRQRAYSVNEVQVDDLFDVIRSRRYAQPTVRDRRPLPA